MCIVYNSLYTVLEITSFLMLFVLQCWSMLICCWLVQKILRVCKMRQCRSRRTQCPEVRQYMRVRAWWFCSLLSKLGCDVIVVTWDRRRGITTWSVWWGVQPPTLPWKWYVAQPCWKWTQQAPIHLSLAGGWRWLTLWCKRGYKSLETSCTGCSGFMIVSWWGASDAPQCLLVGRRGETVSEAKLVDHVNHSW